MPPPEIRRGTGHFVGSNPSSKGTSTSPEGETTLNFVNADIADVAKAVLGDLLKLNYLVDAGVQGSVTLQTSRPLARDIVLPAFEQAIRLAGLAMVQRDGIYRVVPLADAARGTGPLETGRRREPGFGVEIVPLLYVGVPEMQKLLEPLAPKDSILRADPARNLLIIAGTERERAALIDNIRLFDVDWMAGMSFAVLPLKSVDPKTVIAELKEVLGGKDGPLASMVRLVPVSRINSILAISPQPKYLDQLADWVGRLDRIREVGQSAHLCVLRSERSRCGFGGSSEQDPDRQQSKRQCERLEGGRAERTGLTGGDGFDGCVNGFRLNSVDSRLARSLQIEGGRHSAPVGEPPQ
ncbi:MAG: secretin N-terminal domain-containing protein [Aliidongia sp.]